MKSKMFTALISSVFIAFLVCPILAAPIGDIASGIMPDASALPSALDAATVLGWWLSGAFIAHITGTVLTFLLTLCICSSLPIRAPSTRVPTMAACSAMLASRRAAMR